MTVRIVTDSTSDLPLDQAKELGIEIVPLTVTFGDESYLDNVEMGNEAFYQKLQESKELPRTSQPAPAKFQETYIRLMDEGASSILSVHLTSKLSGTYQSACTARDTLPADTKKIPIEIVDSTSISAGMGYPVLKAAEEAQQGVALEEIKANLLDRLARSRIFAVLDTLEYVRRGGRIGGAAAMLGNVLNIKPIIALKDGEVVPIERARTRGKAYARIAQILKELGPLEYLAIAESSRETGEQLAEALKEVYTGEIAIWKLGAVLGTHTGPGTAAISLVTAK